MRLTYPHPPRQVRIDFVAALEAAGFPGASFTSIGEDLYVELPGREELSDEEVAVIDRVVADYVAAPCWRNVRKMRSRLFLELDARVAQASRRARMGDAGAVEELDALDAYGQALCDITEGPDPEHPQWPARPWQ